VTGADPDAVTEPLFILRASDILAPALIRAWAKHATALGVPPAKIRGALRVAQQMEAWQRVHGSKIPD